MNAVSTPTQESPEDHGKNPETSSRQSPAPLAWESRRVKTLLVFIGAIITGVAWRIRGSGPFGGMFGMLVVGTIYATFLFWIFGCSRRATPALVGATAILMAVTAGGWGTIVGQVTGRLAGRGPGGIGAYDIEVSAAAGWFWMFTIGFGWVPLFAAIVGWFFSKRESDAKELVVVAMVFFGVDYLSQLLLAHPFVRWISPDAYQLFADALETLGTGTTPWQEFVGHFLDGDHLETIPGGRNYGSLVNNLSSCFGTLAVAATFKWGFKDGRAARHVLVVAVIFGLSIMVADLWQFVGRGGPYSAETGPSWEVPDWLRAHWSFWEFTTGFLAGLGTTAYVLAQDPGQFREVATTSAPFVPPRWERPLSVLVTYGLVAGFGLVRAVGSQLTRLSGDDPMIFWAYYPIAIGGLLVGALLYLKDLIKLPGWSLSKWCFVALCVYLVGYMVIDRFLVAEFSWAALTIPNKAMIVGTVVALPLLGLGWKWGVGQDELGATTTTSAASPRV